MSRESNAEMIEKNLPSKRERLYRTLLLWFADRMKDRSPEWISSLFMLCWGFSLILPGDTLSGPQYAAFNRFGFTETLWSGIFLGVGFSRMTALYVNGRWPRGPLIRIAGSLFGAISWMHVSTLLYDASWGAGNPMNTGVGVYLVLAIFDSVGIVRAGVDVRYKH